LISWFWVWLFQMMNTGHSRRFGKKHDLGTRGRNFKPKGNCPRCQKFYPKKPYKAWDQGCYTCGENDHIAWDYLKRPMCFNSWQASHISTDCSQRREVNQPNERNQEPQQGHIFSLTRDNVNTNPTIIQGTLIFLNTLVQVLIDLESSHWLVSHALAHGLGLEFWD